MEANYLKITLHDNDFTSYYKVLGNAILDTFNYAGYYPDESNLDMLKPYIANIWYSINNISEIVHHSEECDKTYFDDVKLEIVKYEDIPKWNNAEDIYIPLFPEAEVLLI
jgi:hypothetical protein